MRWLLIGAMLALMIMLAVSHAVATDDAKVNNTTGHVETGGKKIGDGKFVKVVDETAKGISKTVVERKKFAANSSPTGRFPMPRRAFGLVDAELSRRIASILRTQLFNVDADRPKRIDDAIDYFGAGTSTLPEILRRIVSGEKSASWMTHTSMPHATAASSTSPPASCGRRMTTGSPAFSPTSWSTTTSVTSSPKCRPEERTVA